MNPTRYKQNKNEAKIAFVTRIVTSENRPMTASEVFACIDTEAMPDVVAQRIHANLSDAAGNYKMIGKKRMLSKQNEMRVHYFPLGMNVDGEEIPVPLYTKEGGNTFDNEDTPDAVKVAEKVLADLGADDDDDDDLFDEPLILQVLAEYHMTTVALVKKHIGHRIMTARTTEDNRALFDILKEMMA